MLPACISSDLRNENNWNKLKIADIHAKFQRTLCISSELKKMKSTENKLKIAYINEKIQRILAKIQANPTKFIKT